jgi:beta-lactamase class D
MTRETPDVAIAVRGTDATMRSVRIALLLFATMAATALGAVSKAQEAGECFVFARLGEPRPFVSNATECDLKTAPASTFKIPHALIALDTGVVTAETVIKWDGTPRDFESWQRDHTLDSAMKSSVLPFFQRTARSIGAERMRTGLTSTGYASDTFDGEISTFWLNGDLVVSPLEQVAFLQRLFSGSLPTSPGHVSTVTNAIRMPTGQILNAAGSQPFVLNWPAATVVRAKTGNTRVNGEQVSWLVGALELKRITYTFAARKRSSAPLERTAGTAVAIRGLNAQRPE